MAEQPPRALHDLLLEIDRLEELREDLEELGVRSIQEIDERIAELTRLADQFDQAGNGQL